MAPSPPESTIDDALLTVLRQARADGSYPLAEATLKQELRAELRRRQTGKVLVKDLNASLKRLATRGMILHDRRRT
jgi:hypothetical protein